MTFTNIIYIQLSSPLLIAIRLNSVKKKIKYWDASKVQKPMPRFKIFSHHNKFPF